jgi:hypothetical protein
MELTNLLTSFAFYIGLGSYYAVQWLYNKKGITFLKRIAEFSDGG